MAVLEDGRAARGPAGRRGGDRGHHRRRRPAWSAISGTHAREPRGEGGGAPRQQPRRRGGAHPGDLLRPCSGCARPASRWWRPSARWPPRAATTSAAAADRIYANPGTLTGSIGVVMQLANVEGLLKKVGVEYVVVKAGAYKDIGNFARTMTPEERRILQALLDDVLRPVRRGGGAGPQSRREHGARLRRRADLLRPAGAGPEAWSTSSAASRTPSRRAGKLAGCPASPRSSCRAGASPSSISCATELGLGAPRALLPALPVAPDPLYLMY